MNAPFLEAGRTPITDPRTGFSTPLFREWQVAVTNAVSAQTGQLVGLYATLATLNTTGLPVGTLFYATDRGVTYILLAATGTLRKWHYVAGICRGIYTATPALGATDIGFLYDVTDFNHLMRWTGVTWDFAPSDPGNGFFADFAIAPPSITGWALCNGVASSYLDVLGAGLIAVPFTPPNLVATPAYRKGGAAYSGAIVTTGGALTSGGAVDPSHITVLPYFRR